MDKELSALLDMDEIGKWQTRDPLDKIRRAILINACWGILIGSGYLYVLFWLPWIVGPVLVVMSWGVISTFRLYKKLKNPLTNNTVLDQLHRHYTHVRRWIRLQQLLGLAIYPPGIIAGFIFGGSLGSGASVSVFLQRPGMLTLLVILLIVLVPLGFWLGEWMSRKAFGQYAAQLKADIDALTED